jgi:hypothetical protein
MEPVIREQHNSPVLPWCDVVVGSSAGAVSRHSYHRNLPWYGLTAEKGFCCEIVYEGTTVLHIHSWRLRNLESSEILG